MLESIAKILFKIISIKLWSLYLVQHMLHQTKAPQYYTDLGLISLLSNANELHIYIFNGH